jgi:hypothetical protein
MIGDVSRRRVRLLAALYQLGPEDGRLTVAAVIAGRDAGGPELNFDKYGLIGVGLIEEVPPARAGMVDDELYMVTPKGEKILRKWGRL